MTRVALLTATILAAATIGLSTTASALTAEQVADMYSDTYVVVSVVPSETDPSVYEMTVMVDGVETVILVDVETGEVVATEDPVADEPATEEMDVADKEECKNDGWLGFEFRNQGQCIRFVNTGVDTRPWAHPRAEAEGEEASDRDACKHGGWEDLGYRNQGQCVADR